MVIGILLFAIIGVFIGVFTGMLPGIHINLVAVGIASVLPLIGLDPFIAGILIISIATTHIFVDFLPTTFLGVPSAESSIALLPSQRLLLAGKSYEAIFLAVFGCLIGVLIITVMSPLLMLIIEPFYNLIKGIIGYLLISCLLALVIKEKNILWAIAVVAIAGLFGVVSFNLNANEVLFPMFSGLFGLSSLIMSIKYKTSIPEQIKTNVLFDKIKTMKTFCLGVLASLLVGFLPGVGSAQASTLAMMASKKTDEDHYIILVGAINSIVMVLAIMALFAIGKSRNGAVAIVNSISSFYLKEHFFLLMGIVLFASGIAAIITMMLFEIFRGVVARVNYPFVCYFVIFMIVLLTVFISDMKGMLVLLVGGAIGIIPISKNVSRTNLMACLIIPVIFYYLI